MRHLPLFTTMSIEEILNTDHFTALPEGGVIEDALNCQESDEEIERLPNICFLLYKLYMSSINLLNNPVV